MTLKNTDKTYIIKVINAQTIDSVTDTIEQSAKGSYYEKGDKKYILYKTEENNIITSTIIIIENGTVIIRRKGEIESNMHFVRGETTTSSYILPYGKMIIHINTEAINDSLNIYGGELSLKYELLIQGEKYYNDMKIKLIGESV